MLDNYLLWLVLCALLIGFLIVYRLRLRTWLSELALRHPTLSQKRRRRSLRCPFPTKRPDCPLCQGDEHTSLPPEPPVMPPAKRGPKPTVNTRFHFCPKVDCCYYGWLNKGNIITNGFPNSGSSRQLKCRAYHCFFSETKGTLFYRLKTPPERILLTLKVLAEGLDLQATARVFEVKVRTVQRWLEYAAQHMDSRVGQWRRGFRPSLAVSVVSDFVPV